jgi:hypothetical protein
MFSWHNSDFCYVFINQEIEAGPANVRDIVKFHDTKGIGYAISTTEELEFIKIFEMLSRIVLIKKAFKKYIEFLNTIQSPPINIHGKP